MGSLIIIVIEPFVQIFWQAPHLVIEVLAQGHLVELLQDSLMEALTDAISLWRPYLGFRVFNVIDRQIQLIIVGFCPAALFGAAIRQYP